MTLPFQYRPPVGENGALEERPHHDVHTLNSLFEHPFANGLIDADTDIQIICASS